METRKTFQAKLDSLSPIRDFLNEIIVPAGLDKKRMYNLCLAIDEIATNIINHGYLESGMEPGVVDVIIQIENNVVTTILEDDAVQYDPLTHILPDADDLSLPLEERPIGGLGVLIAKQSVDEFKYEFVNKRNRNIFIIKKIVG